MNLNSAAPTMNGVPCASSMRHQRVRSATLMSRIPNMSNKCLYRRFGGKRTALSIESAYICFPHVLTMAAPPMCLPLIHCTSPATKDNRTATVPPAQCERTKSSHRDGRCSPVKRMLAREADARP
jgi:hypothetical protein